MSRAAHPPARKVAASGASATGPGIFSIGHSNIPVETLLDLLESAQIEVVADVRTVPHSRYVPQFNAEPLGAKLAERRIRYLPFGRQLGGRPDGDEFYDEEGHVRYDRLAESAEFRAGIERVLAGGRKYRIALLCSEEDPARCHRHLLIGRVLTAEGADLRHIRANGRIQSDVELDTAAEDDPAQQELFTPAPRERSWRSLRSVSRRRALLSSSEH